MASLERVSLSRITQTAERHFKSFTIDTSTQKFKNAFLTLIQNITRSSPNQKANDPSAIKSGEENEKDTETVVSGLLESGYRWSYWKRFCPVRFRIDRAIVEGSHPATYRGRIYLLSSTEYVKEFVSNPSYYLKRRPQRNQRVVFVWNGSEGGEVFDEGLYWNILDNIWQCLNCTMLTS